LSVIATLVMMQSTLDATLIISVERIAATALGALVGALLAIYFTGNVFAFAAAVFVIGIVCIALRMERTAYRYAGITLAIIVLISGSNPAWIVALHRFFEVSAMRKPERAFGRVKFAFSTRLASSNVSLLSQDSRAAAFRELSSAVTVE
jgi:hypothetical protein